MSTPEQFDAEFYLEMNPDVRASGWNAYDHYVAHGKAEGRPGTWPLFDIQGDFAGLDPKRESVLVVSHEASKTGAPVLSINIARELRKKYNVVALLLNGGNFVDGFKPTADVVVGPLVRSHNERILAHHLGRLLGMCRFKFAFVNSIVSRIVLPELSRLGVPTVSLIHEFASYTRPRDAFADVVRQASDVVFSAEVVRENALATLPAGMKRPMTVLAQGQCTLEPRVRDAAASAMEAQRITDALRPPGWPKDTFVVLGVGLVQIRKGVDLFIACADRVLRGMGGRPCRFVWIGGGFDPEDDNAYSSYLEDQVGRAQLGDRFAFVSETDRIDVAYAQADCLVISSRLDPLPNVAIDAMVAGLPLACFDRASGAAEILLANGLGRECVASYLDGEELAQRVLAFGESPELRREVGARLKDVAQKVFDMADYTAKLEAIALRCAEQLRK